MPPSLQPQSTLEPLHAYAAKVKAGKLVDDEGQRLVIAHLQALYRALLVPKTRRFLDKIIPIKPAAAAHSIYIWGAVGRGKSLLMDMFYDSAPCTKRRIHFHAFMQDVHAKIHAARNDAAAKELHRELLPSVARTIATEYGRLICLDELQVTDVADAMILSTLFAEWLKNDVTFVITSNRPPEELYLGGLQREKFLEFVHLVCARMEVLQLVSPHDYRMQQIRAMQAVYMWPLTEKADSALQNIFAELTHHTTPVSTTLEVQGRALTLKETYGGIARASFAELCEKPLGAADYLAIARRFHTLFLTYIPQLGIEKRNEAKRFVTLIDTLYDHRVKLICTAEVPPAELYAAGDGTFEFGRTVSRLAEMQSAQYLETPHIP